MSAPPPYNQGNDQSAYGQGFAPPLTGYNNPATGNNAPPTGYGAPGQGFAPPVTTNVMHVPAPQFGSDPVTTVCRNCHANITTSTSSETGVIAWVSAGVLCLIGCWCCFWIPLGMNSLKDVLHKCPNCKAVVGRYKAKI